jgi:hydrogenase maturation protease
MTKHGPTASSGTLAIAASKPDRPASLVVIGIGNPSRGDDAIGPLLVERLMARLAREPRDVGANIELIEDFQLQVEHALDLVGRVLVLFIDAGIATAPPYRFTEIGAAPSSASHSTHALTPSQVLGCYRQVTGEAPPPAFALCVRGESFELGDDLSTAARRHCDAAFARLLALCRSPQLERWRELASPPSPAC